MGKDIAFIAVYRCPGCDVALEAADGDADWRRCPRCGRASRPPDRTARPRPTARPVRDTSHRFGRSGEELLWIGDDRKREREQARLKVLAALASVTVPVVICLAFGQGWVEASMVGIVMAVALIILARPRAERR